MADFYKRAYSKTNKVYLYGSGGLLALFAFIQVYLGVYGFTVTDWNGNEIPAIITCAGNAQERCLQDIRITSSNYSLVFKNTMSITLNDTDGVSYILRKKDTLGRLRIFNITGKTLQNESKWDLQIEIIKPINKTVKWSIQGTGVYDSEILDPIVKGYSAPDFFTSLNDYGVRSGKAFLDMKVANPLSVPISVNSTLLESVAERIKGNNEVKNPKFYYYGIVEKADVKWYLQNNSYTDNSTGKLIWKIVNTTIPREEKQGWIEVTNTIVLQPKTTYRLKYEYDWEYKLGNQTIDIKPAIKVSDTLFKREDWAFARTGYTAYRNLTVTTPAGTHAFSQVIPQNMSNAYRFGINISGLTLARQDKNASKELVFTTASNITLAKQILYNGSSSTNGSAWVVVMVLVNSTQNITVFYNYHDANEADTLITQLPLEDNENYAVAVNADRWVYDDQYGNTGTFTAKIYDTAEGGCSWCGNRYIILNDSTADVLGSRNSSNTNLNIASYPYSLFYSVKQITNDGIWSVFKKTGTTVTSQVLMNSISIANCNAASSFVYHSGEGYTCLSNTPANMWHNYSITAEQPNYFSYIVNSTSFLNKSVSTTAGTIVNISFAASSATGVGSSGLDNVFLSYGRILNDSFNPSLFISNEVTETTADTSSPNVSLVFPTDNSYNTTTVNFGFKANDTNGIQNCSLRTTEGGWSINWNVSAVLNNTETSIARTFSGDGNWVWNIECYDPSANKGTATSNQTVKVDTTGPIVNHIFPANNSWNASQTNYFGYKAWDTNGLKNCSINVYDGESIGHANELSPSNNTEKTLAYSPLNDGTYPWYASCYDNANNYARNSTNWTVYIDRTKPVIVLDNPTNNSELATPEYINLSISDTNLANTYWINESGTGNSTSFIGTYDISTVGWTAATHTIKVWAIDNAGNHNYSVYRLTFNECKTYSVANTITNLTGNSTASATCITIGADNQTIDGGGYWINYSWSSTGRAITDNNYDNITLRNLNIIEGGTNINSYGIYGATVVTNSSIENVDIQTQGSGSIPIYLVGSHGNNVSNSRIKSSGGNGIVIQSSDRNIVLNNSVNVTGNLYGIYLYNGADDNNISNNKINATGASAVGIYVLSLSRRNNITENTINSSGGYGVLFNDLSSPGIVKNNTIITTADGSITLGIATDNITITDNIINNFGTTSSSYGIYLSGSRGHNVTGGSIRARSGGTDYYLSGITETNFTNTNFTNRSIYFDDATSRFKYRENQSDNIFIATNSFSAITTLYRTAIGTWSPTKIVWNDTAQNKNFNYTITGLYPNMVYNVKNASRSGVSNIYSITTDSDGTLTFNISLKWDGVTTANSTEIMVTEGVLPNITVISPLNITYNSSQVWMNITASEELNWAAYSLDSTSSEYTICYQESSNESSFCGGAGNGVYSFSNAFNDRDWTTGLADNITYYINYSKPQSASGSLWQVKSTSQSCIFTTITYLINLTIPSDCWAYNSTSVILSSVSITDSGNRKSMFFCQNATEWKNIGGQNTGCGIGVGNNVPIYEEAMYWNISANTTMTNYAGNNWSILATGLSDGNHNVRFYFNDTVGNMNQSDLIYFSVDTPPAISFTSPTLNSVSNNIYIYVNLTTDKALNTTLLQWNGQNYTMNNSAGLWKYINWTGLSNGNYTFKAYANTTTGRANETALYWSYLNWTGITFYLNGTATDKYYELGGVANVTGCSRINGVMVMLNSTNPSFANNFTRNTTCANILTNLSTVELHEFNNSLSEVNSSANGYAYFTLNKVSDILLAYLVPEGFNTSVVNQTYENDVTDAYSPAGYSSSYDTDWKTYTSFSSIEQYVYENNSINPAITDNSQIANITYILKMKSGVPPNSGNIKWSFYNYTSDSFMPESSQQISYSALENYSYSNTSYNEFIKDAVEIGKPLYSRWHIYWSGYTQDRFYEDYTILKTPTISQYPENVTIDVGNDSQLDWIGINSIINGTYGILQKFKGYSAVSSMTFTSGGTGLSYIDMPCNSTINSFSFNWTGGNGTYLQNEFDNKTESSYLLESQNLTTSISTTIPLSASVQYAYANITGNKYYADAGSLSGGLSPSNWAYPGTNTYRVSSKAFNATGTLSMTGYWSFTGNYVSAPINATLYFKDNAGTILDACWYQFTSGSYWSIWVECSGRSISNIQNAGDVWVDMSTDKGGTYACYTSGDCRAAWSFSGLKQYDIKNATNVSIWFNTTGVGGTRVYNLSSELNSSINQIVDLNATLINSICSASSSDPCTITYGITNLEKGNVTLHNINISYINGASNVTIDIADDGRADYSMTGAASGSYNFTANSTVLNVTQSYITGNCLIKSLPVSATTATSGTIALSNLYVNYTPNVNLNLTAIGNYKSNRTGNIDIPIKVSALYWGKLRLKSLQVIGYWDKNYTFYAWAEGSIANASQQIRLIWSNISIRYPSGVSNFVFRPRTVNSTAILPDGQTNSTPFYNISCNSQSQPTDIYLYLGNSTITGLNFTALNSSNYTNRINLNTTPQKMYSNCNTGGNVSIWFWEDLNQVNSSAYRYWKVNVSTYAKCSQCL